MLRYNLTVVQSLQMEHAKKNVLAYISMSCSCIFSYFKFTQRGEDNNNLQGYCLEAFLPIGSAIFRATFTLVTLVGLP